MTGWDAATLAVTTVLVVAAVVLRWDARRTWARTRALLVSGDPTTVALRAAARQVLRAEAAGRAVLGVDERDALRAAVEVSTDVDAGMLGEGPR